MPLILDDGDAIRGKASVASKVDYTVFGLDGSALKALADGQLGTSEADVYAASGVDSIATLVLVNTDTSARTVNLYFKASGGTSRAITPTVTLAAGYSLHTDGTRIRVYDTNGVLQVKITSGAGDVATDSIWDAKGDLAAGTGANTSQKLTVGANTEVLTADSAETTGLKWATAATGLSSKIITATRDMTAASGDVSYTGVGFQPTALICFATESGYGRASWCFCDSARVEAGLRGISSSSFVQLSDVIVNIYFTGATQHRAIVKSYDADGFTLTWTKVGSPTGTAYLKFLCLK